MVSLARVVPYFGEAVLVPRRDVLRSGEQGWRLPIARLDLSHRESGVKLCVSAKLQDGVVLGGVDSGFDGVANKGS